MARTSSTPLDRQINRVRRRLFLQNLVERTMGCWLGSLVCAAGWFLLEPYVVRHAGMPSRWLVAGGFVTAGSALALLLTLRRIPSRVAAALALDERFLLKERTTTAALLSAKESATPAGQALLADANARLEPLRVRDRFPLRIPRLAVLLPFAAAGSVLLVCFSQPNRPPTHPSIHPLLVDNPLAKAQIDKAFRPLQRPTQKKPGERPKSEELQRLEAELDKLSQKPRDTQEQARALVKDLTEAEDRVRKREKELADRAEALKEQMKQIERLGHKEKLDGPAKKLDDALDRGDLKQARDEAERLGKRLQADEEVARLRKKMKEDKLTEDQKREMRERLNKLKDQELSREQREQMDEQLQDIKEKLERLTRSDEAKERLREMQRKGALNQEELERELDQIDKNLAKIDEQTREQLQELANKLGECRKCLNEGKEDEAAKKLGEAAERLAQLDPNGECQEMQRQVRQLQQARKAVCQALDGKPQPGAGSRPESKDGDTAVKEEWAHSSLDKGRLQVIDHVPGDGFKGPRKPAEMTEEIRRAAQEEPEALDRQRLPRSASDMARGYFEKLRGPDRKREKMGR